jgi:hypothetical protein
MGDRCWAALRIKSSDIEEFKKLDDFDNDDIDSIEETVEIQFDEINYGGEHLLDSIAAAGLCCTMEHGAGGNYGPGEEIVFFGYRHYRSITHDGSYYIAADSNGDPVPDSIEELKNHIKIRDLVLKYFKSEIFNYAAELAKLKFTNDPILEREVA